MTKSILYIVNSYGTPPLNYFEKYLKENRKAFVTILKLPAIRLLKNKISLDAFIKDEGNKVYKINLNIFFPLPYFLVFLLQYLINFVLLFILLSKIKRKKFDIVIGETNFGSCISFILRKLHVAKFSIFFNGDIIPYSKWSDNCFFLPNKNKKNPFYKSVDNFLIKIQYWLRNIGYKNDLIWFANKKIADFDSKKGLVNRNNIINDPILVDYRQSLKYSLYEKRMNTLCYIGRIDDYVGLDIIIPALKVIKKTITNIQLLIIGGNEISFERYKRLAIKNEVANKITFYGYVPEIEKAFKLMSHAALGIALYKPVKDNVSMYTQPGKPKEYIKLGIPVLLSKNGPEIGRQIIRYKAGVESDFNIESVSKTIINVLTDKYLYTELQKGVLHFANEYNYKARFKEIWEEITKSMNL